MIKYILRPGYVRSQTDGQKHFITAHQLAFLYKVSMRECLIVNEDRDLKTYFFNDKERDAMLLYPRYDGNYALDNL